MNGIKRTLLAIAAFVTLAVGSFIYFIANWDSAKAAPISGQIEVRETASLFILPNKLRGLGQRPSPALTTSGTAT